MTPLIEILLAVATYYPCGSDPHRGPAEMLDGLHKEWCRILDMAVEAEYVKRIPYQNPAFPGHVLPDAFELTSRGRRALFNGLKDA